MKYDRVHGERADAYGSTRLNKEVRQRKNRYERRKAKQNPEVTPGYGKYRGWLS